MIVYVGYYPAGAGIVLQVVKYPVHLIHIPFGIMVLYPQLVAIGLTDGAVLIGPAVPDVAAEVADVVRLLLPDPQKLLHA